MTEVYQTGTDQEPETAGEGERDEQLPDTGIYAQARMAAFCQLADPEQHQELSLGQKYDQFPPLTKPESDTG